MTGYARGGIVPQPDGPHGDEVPLMLSGTDHLLPPRTIPDDQDDEPREDSGEDDGEFVCGRCLRSQHARCSEPSCRCCMGNVEDERFG